MTPKEIARFWEYVWDLGHPTEHYAGVFGPGAGRERENSPDEKMRGLRLTDQRSVHYNNRAMGYHRQQKGCVCSVALSQGKDTPLVHTGPTHSPIEAGGNDGEINSSLPGRVSVSGPPVSISEEEE